MAWQHRYCGTIVDGERGNPPAECDFCRELLIRIPRAEDKGWLKIAGPAPRSRSEKKAAKKAVRRSGRRRGKISKTKREFIYKRDGYKCVRCGEDDRAELTLDHIVPVSRGGTERNSNLQTMCRHCNGLKADKTGSNGMRWPPDREMKRAGLLP